MAEGNKPKQFAILSFHSGVLSTITESTLNVIDIDFEQIDEVVIFANGYVHQTPISCQKFVSQQIVKGIDFTCQTLQKLI